MKHSIGRRIGEGVLSAIGPLAVAAVVVFFGALMAREKIAIVRPLKFIGHVDEAAYVTQAQSLAEGRGLQVNYVSFFFIPYSSEITHREDHWPPFIAFVAAPFVRLWGPEAWVIKLSPILIGSIGLPLAAAFLGMMLARRAYVGLAAGLLMLLNGPMFTASLCMLSDIALAMLLTGFLAAVLAARYRPWLHLLAGALAAGAYYAKGSEIILLGLYPVVAVLMCGPRVAVRKWMWLGMGTMVVLLAPFLYSNWKLSGNPLHSTQNFVAGYWGVTDDNAGLSWERGSYTVYWGKDLPNVTDRWKKYPERYWPLVEANREVYTRWAFLGVPTEKMTGTWAWDELGAWGRRVRMWVTTGKWPALTRRIARLEVKPVQEWVEPYTTVPNLAGAGFAGLLAAVTLPGMLGLGIWRWWRKRRREKRGLPEEVAEGVEPPWLLGPVLAVLLVLGVHWAFFVYLWHWEWMARLGYAFLPGLTVLGLTGAARLVELPIGGVVGTWATLWPGKVWWWVKYWHVPVSVAAAGAVLWLGVRNDYAQGWIREIADAQRAEQYGAYPYADGWSEQQIMATGRFLKEHYPDTVFMSRYPKETRWYASRETKAVALPCGSAEQIFAVAKYYHVRLLVNDMVNWETGERRALEPYFSGRRPGLKRVEGAPVEMYEIQWDKLKVKTEGVLGGTGGVGERK